MDSASVSWNPELIGTRHVRSGRGRRIDTIETVRAVIKQRWFHQFVNVVSEIKPEQRTGRPRRHSSATVALMYLLNLVLDSQAEAETYIKSMNYWEALRRVLAAEFPDDPLLARGAPTPTRSVIRHLKKDFSADVGDQMRKIMEADAIIRAAVMYLGDNSGTMLEPSRNAVLFGDGVVVRPPSNFRPGDRGVDPRTGELKPRRHDPDATFHINGMGERVYGNQFAHLSAFTGHSGEHITFSVRPIRKGEGPTEAELAIEMAATVVKSRPGFAALTWDKALRSHSIDGLWDLRLQPLVGVYDKTGKSTEIVPLDVHLVEGLKVRAFAFKGAVSIRSNTGQPIVLDPVKISYHPNRTGSLRAYGTFRIPAGAQCDTRLWNRTIRQRLNSRDRSELVYGEHVRALPPGSPRWKLLYGNRSLAESLNARYKAGLLPGQRARSYGHDRQWIDFIVTLMVWNTKASLLFARRTGRPPSSLVSAA